VNGWHFEFTLAEGETRDDFDVWFIGPPDSGGSGGFAQGSWSGATFAADGLAADETNTDLIGSAIPLFAAPEATALAGSGFDGLGEGTVAVETVVPPVEPDTTANVPFLLFAHDDRQGIDAALE
jgi:hypothetical protein